MNDNIVVLDRIRLALGRGASRIDILRGIDLAIERGSSVGILGPSGSGKSTLLAVLAGLERPDHGRVLIENVNLTAKGEDELARFRGRHIGIVFQSFHLIPTMTALENVAIPLELAGDRSAFARAESEMAAVGLADRLDHYPAELSGGEQQRVAIARALAPAPSLIIADEPTGNLDEATGHAIIELLFRRRREEGATLVLVTHDAELAAACDRRIRLRSGRVEQDSAVLSLAAE